MKRHSLKVLAGLLLSAGLTTPALAADPAVAKLKPKDFPNQPIEYTVVYPAGGGMDVTARLLAKYVEKVSGDKVLVNNRTGGGGMVGHTFLATQAKNDGYTVVFVPRANGRSPTSNLSATSTATRSSGWCRVRAR